MTRLFRVAARKSAHSECEGKSDSKTRYFLLPNRHAEENSSKFGRLRKRNPASRRAGQTVPAGALEERTPHASAIPG
jgi:hypothetical protein